MQKAPTIGPNGHERAEDDQAPAGRATDPHSKRILRDHAEWFSRLTKLAELRHDGE
jgi:hypothetical protein